MEERNDIVIYRSEDGLVKMEALVDPAGETIWATQKAIAALFDCTKQNVFTTWERYLRAENWSDPRSSKKFKLPHRVAPEVYLKT